MKELFSGTIGVIIGILFFSYGIVQLVAGYQGISAEIGSGWAIAAIVVAIVFRFTLPITVGAFFGAMNVWGWHWIIALLFALPGLAFVIPGVLMGLIGVVAESINTNKR